MTISIQRADVALQTDVWSILVDIWVWIKVSLAYWVYVSIDWAITTYPPCKPYVIWIAPIFGIPTTAFSSVSSSSSASASASATAVEVVQRVEGAQSAFDIAGPNMFLLLVFVLAIIAIVALAAIAR